ncbi:esterase-like activity of phytase family protein, partial [Acinetobacter soli]
IDPESIRMAQNGHVYISSEGNYSSNSTDLYQPFIREYSGDGAIIRQFDIMTFTVSINSRNSSKFNPIKLSLGSNVIVANQA